MNCSIGSNLLELLLNSPAVKGCEGFTSLAASKLSLITA